MSLGNEKAWWDMVGITFKDLYLDSKRFPKAGDEPFDVPQEILEKPHYIFGFHVVVLYENDDEALSELCRGFEVTGQALWNWRREGLPQGRKEQAQTLIESEKFKFRLAQNITLDQIVRPYAGPKRRSTGGTKENHCWLTLLSEIEGGKFAGLRRKDIPRIVSNHSGLPLPKWSPYRWGWSNGGVPPSYARAVWEALMDMGIHEKLKLNKDEFIEHCNKHYRAPTRSRRS